MPRDNGADWDFADVRDHYLRARYGPDASEAAAQRVTGEVMAEVFGEWRRPGSGCGGGIVLWLRDLAPGAGWGLLDHTGRPKPAALALAPALQPTAVWLVDEGLNGLDVHVAHDGPDAVGATLTVDLLRDDGSVIESAEEAWTLEPHGHRVLGVESLLGRFADASYAYRFGPPPHAAVRARLVTASGVERELAVRPASASTVEGSPRPIDRRSAPVTENPQSDETTGSPTPPTSTRSTRSPRGARGRDERGVVPRERPAVVVGRRRRSRTRAPRTTDPTP